MKRIAAIFATFMLTATAVFAMAGSANAENEAVTADLKMTPKSGTTYKDAFKPVDWQIKTNVTGGPLQIQPTKVIDLQLPNGQVNFNIPKGMPVCDESKVGEGKNSIPVPQVIAKCPDSILGNGTAKFAAGQAPGLLLDGLIVVFNGGTVKDGPDKGQPILNIYAYSYDTTVGIGTSSALSKDGKMQFKLPQLTSDSSVTTMTLDIPGKPFDFYVDSAALTVKMPGGQAPNYVTAKCSTGTWALSGKFTFGDRDTSGADSGPTTYADATSSSTCASTPGKAKFANLKIKGPGSVKKGKKGTYKVTVTNNGTATATGVKVAATGKGVSGKGNGGTIAAGASKVVTVKAKFAKPGKIKAKFKATGKGAAAKTGTKTVKVK